MITTVCFDEEVLKQIDILRKQYKYKWRSRSQAINYFLIKGMSEFSQDEKVVKFFKKLLGE